MRSLISHLRLALRGLLKSPGFAVTAILILGFGIGANTAIFSLVNAVLLKPLPYPHPEQLVQTVQLFDYPDYVDIRSRQRSFQELALYENDEFNLAGQGDPERVNGAYVSGAFFQVLGRPFLKGRPISEAEDRPDKPRVVVVSEHFWKAYFQSDPNVIGTSLLLNGQSFQIIGVTPAQANELAPVDLYVPLNQSPYYGTVAMTGRAIHNYSCIGRLKDGATLEAAKAELKVIVENLFTRYPQTNVNFRPELVRYLDLVIRDYAATLWLMEGAVAGLLLISCANIANLLLARTQERRREISIRAALGANRGRLILQLLLENSVLALFGGFLGLLLSEWAVEVIRTMAPSDLGRFQEVKLDTGACVFVVLVSLLTAILSGLYPALVNSRTNLASTLKQEGGRAGTVGRERRRGQALLVTGQVALTFVLLIGAGLFVRSFRTLQETPLGFSTDHILTTDFYLTDGKYATQAQCDVLFDRLLAGVKQLPGVKAAGLDSSLPFLPSSPDNVNDTFWVIGRSEPQPDKLPQWQLQFISPDYFRAMAIPILRGRSFTEEDATGKAKVIIISQSVADQFFPGQDPVGKQIHDFHDRFGLKRNLYTVVGVVGTVQFDNPEARPASLQAYYLYAENDLPTPANFGTLVIHTEGDPGLMVPRLRKLVAQIDPNLPLSNVGTVDNLVTKSFAMRRLAAAILGLFSGTGLLLAAVGLYGVLSYAVSQKKREIGVRIALGAGSVSILRLISLQGLKIVAVGLFGGIIIALALSRSISSVLYGVSPIDPLSIVGSVIVLGLAALVACFVPALRASRIDPITALRE